MTVKTKKLLCLLVAVVLLLGVAACKGGSSEPEKKEKVAFLIPGPISDMSWCYAAYVGSEMIKEDGYEVSYQENTADDELVSSLRTYASEGYTCIFIATNANKEDLVAAAADYPDVQVFIVMGDTVTENVNTIFFADEDQGFMMGAVAGALTKTNKIAYIAGIDFIPFNNAGMGFEQGAKLVNPDVDVKKVIIGTTTDIGIAKETAKSLYETGIDVIGPNANQASLGVVEAAGEIGDVVCVGSGEGMAELAPAVVPCSVNMNTAVGYYAAFQKYLKGELAGSIEEVTTYGVADGLVTMPEWFAEFEGEVSEDAKEKVKQAFDDLKSGAVVINLVG